MTEFRPQDRVLYRDGDRFFVGRVDLVKDRYLTVFPFDPTRRSWSSKNRRVPASFVIGKLTAEEKNSDRVAEKIERLRNQREAMRQQANRWLEDNVRQLIGEAG